MIRQALADEYAVLGNIVGFQVVGGTVGAQEG